MLVGREGEVFWVPEERASADSIRAVLHGEGWGVPSGALAEKAGHRRGVSGSQVCDAASSRASGWSRTLLVCVYLVTSQAEPRPVRFDAYKPQCGSIEK